MKEYYFIRHGQTDYNKMRIVQGSGIDSDLNHKGRRQAELFYEHYQSVPFDHIITSELKRSFQTVEPFVKKKGLSFERTALINEISWGVHEGQKGTLEMKQNYDRMISEWMNGNFDARLQGAESARELADRTTAFITYLTSLPQERVLICTHGRTLRCLLCVMKNQHLREMENYEHHNTGLFLAHYDANQFVFHVENDVRHFD